MEGSRNGQGRGGAGKWKRKGKKTRRKKSFSLKNVFDIAVKIINFIKW